MGAGKAATQWGASKLTPFLGKKIAQGVAEGVGAGAVSGGVFGTGNAAIEGENPIVGGSFGGLFDKKVQEVISGYFKNENIKANISMDTNFFEDPESTYGNFLSYKKYLEEIHNEGDADLLLVPFKELSEICDNLEKIKEGISKKFLCYIYFMICLLERRNKKPLTALSPIALSMVDAEPDEESILETALLDLRGPIEKKKANEEEPIEIIEKPKTKKKPKSLADDNEYWTAMEQCFGKYDYA